MFFKVLYNMLINSGWALAHLVALFDQKFRQSIKARNNQLPAIAESNNKNNKLIWMHCSSLGEFEQGKPVLQELKRRYPESRILLSFFSPSGYERVKIGALVDQKVYLPVDRYNDAVKFIRKYQPDLAIFVKYDFWYNFIRALNKLQVRTIFISVLIHSNHFLLKSFARPILSELKKIDRVFVQDKASYDLLQHKGFENIKLAGDTRVDTVVALSEMEFKDEIIEQFCNTDKDIVLAGSCWKKDIELLGKLGNEKLSRYKWIIVPHEIREGLINFIEISFDQYKVSKYSDNPDGKSDILVVDTIGILKFLYRYARFVYIGGGFGAGIHNTLEPAAYGKPVFFGPRYKKFVEAKVLVEQEVFFAVNNGPEMAQKLSELEVFERYDLVSAAIKNYIGKNRDATNTIIDDLHLIWKN